MSEKQLEPFDPENRNCPKCDSILLTLAWRDEQREGVHNTRDMGEWDAPEKEHFRRECSTCGYHWYEGPKEQEDSR